MRWKQIEAEPTLVNIKIITHIIDEICAKFYTLLLVSIISIMIIPPFTSSRSRPIVNHVLPQLVWLGGQVVHHEHIVRYRLHLHNNEDDDDDDNDERP